MANILGKITINNILYLEVDTNPSGGTVAPIGSHANAVDGSGEYYKFGAGNTDWVLLVSGGLISVTYAQLTSLIGLNGLVAGQQYLLNDFATRQNIPNSAFAGTNATTTLLEQIVPSIGTSVVIGARNYDWDGTNWSNIDNGFIYTNIGDAINGDASTEVNAVFDGIDTWNLTALILGTAGNSIVTTVTPTQVGFSFPSGTMSGGLDPTPDVVNTGSVEPLILTANSVNTVYPNAISTIFTQDELLYEVVDSTTAGGNKGRIYYRKDFNQNSTWYDWRVVLFRRYETTPSSGEFWEIYNNGGAFQDFFTFNNSATASGCYNNSIGRTVTSSTDGLSNSIFNFTFFDNEFGAECWNNTFTNLIGSVLGNTVKSYFNNNLIRNGAFYYNNIGDTFQSNSIVGYFALNNIGESFNGNQISSVSGFINNNISNDFLSNTIGGDYFQSNITGHYFVGNTIASAFQNNFGINFTFNNFGSGGFSIERCRFGVSCSSNSSNAVFWDNDIGDSFNSNSFANTTNGNRFGQAFSGNGFNDVVQYNAIEFGFANNIVSGAFTYNKIASQFQNNQLVSFSRNVTNDLFSGNTFLGDCQQNVFNSFFNNTSVGVNFNQNELANNCNITRVGQDFTKNKACFFNCTIGRNCQYNDFGVQSNLLVIGDYFNNNIISIPEYYNVDFSTATYVYATLPSYKKEILNNSGGTPTLVFLDSGNTFQFIQPPNS